LGGVRKEVKSKVQIDGLKEENSCRGGGELGNISKGKQKRCLGKFPKPRQKTMESEDGSSLSKKILTANNQIRGE